MTSAPASADEAAKWVRSERDRRGWSTTKLADVARAIARREGSSIGLAQQSISGFEQGAAKRMPQWLRYVEMAFEEGEPPVNQDTQPRDDLVYLRQVDISYAMGDGAEILDYPETTLVPFNLNFLQSLSGAPLERMFLAMGHGESMEPTLLRNDVILIDTTQTAVKHQDMMWALTYAGAGMIKRLRRVKTDGRETLLIMSDNPLVPPQSVELDDVYIVGKVLWVGRKVQ